MTAFLRSASGAALGRARMVLAASALGAASATWAADLNEATEAIYALPRNGYKREQLPDGSYRAESYTLERGECWGGEIADNSIDPLGFGDITKAISGPLAGQNYIAARNAAAAQLRIVVSWGTTRAPEYRSMSMANAQLEDAERSGHGPGTAQTGALSGVADSVLALAYPTVPGFTDTPAADSNPISRSEAAIAQQKLEDATRAMSDDTRMWRGLVAGNAVMLGYTSIFDAEMQRFRYFVVLQAYDNHPAPGQKAQLRWEARISISQHHNQFDLRLPAMVLNAAPYFGQNSGGLVHQDIPPGRVEIGEVRSLDDVSAASTAALAPDGVHAAYLCAERRGRRLVIVDLDHPGQLVFGDVPNLGAIPVEFGWTDAAHVEVTLSSNAAFTFDAAGRRTDVWTAPARVRPVADPGAVAAAAAAKFPHRTVAVRGWDQGGQRFLLEVAGAPGGARYYVFDRPADVLFDLGRAPPAP